MHPSATVSIVIFCHVPAGLSMPVELLPRRGLVPTTLLLDVSYLFKYELREVHVHTVVSRYVELHEI